MDVFFTILGVIAVFCIGAALWVWAMIGLIRSEEDAHD